MQKNKLPRAQHWDSSITCFTHSMCFAAPLLPCEGCRRARTSLRHFFSFALDNHVFSPRVCVCVCVGAILPPSTVMTSCICIRGMDLCKVLIGPWGARGGPSSGLAQHGTARTTLAPKVWRRDALACVEGDRRPTAGNRPHKLQDGTSRNTRALPLLGSQASGLMLTTGLPAGKGRLESYSGRQTST